MSPLRVLVVDDDRDFAESLASVLAVGKHEVELAFSGEEAIRLFTEKDFDVAFMDVRLPGKNGVESFLEMRKIKPNAKVIMMTGYSVETLLNEAVENGAWAILHKPFDARGVLNMLEQIRPAGILIADDDADFVDSLTHILKEEGHTVFVAKNGEEALERLVSNGVDILILDLRMPLLGGLEVYLQVREAGRALPTIIVTAYGKEETDAIAKLKDLAVSGVLVKPFDPAELLKILQKLDSGRAATHQ